MHSCGAQTYGQYSAQKNAGKDAKRQGEYEGTVAMHSQAELARLGGRNAQKNANRAATGTLLSGAGELLKRYSAPSPKSPLSNTPSRGVGVGRGLVPR